MKFVIFGLTISSSWGNGHATLWRGLCNALIEFGHHVVFFERDVPYYSQNRDYSEIPGGRLRLYSDWDEISASAERELKDADVAMVTSYCPDGIAASDLVLNSAATLRTFYDLDTPVTLEKLNQGVPLSYVGERAFQDFDLVLSYTGGAALDLLRERLGARAVAPLYGSVSPAAHRPVPRNPQYEADFSYLGTYADDRQAAVEELFVGPARKLPNQRFLIAGAQYPADFPWTSNIFFVRHLPPAEHPAFYCSSRLTLNVTRRAMAHLGYCPSGRLFEAAACGVPILTDYWEGLEQFFEPATEILVAHSAEDVIRALEMSNESLSRIARAARERTLEEHTARRRAEELINIVESHAMRAVRSGAAV